RAGDPKEYAADFNHCDTDTFARVGSQLMRWAADNAEAVAKATPEIPSGFHNRRRANWVPLLAIAEAGDWKTMAWKAALAIEAVADTFDPSIGIELLRAIKTAFGARNADRITSADLIAELLRDETAPWATYNRGKPISQRQIAGLLKPYGIKPKVIRLDDGNTPRGYLLEWFVDVFDRFCTPSSARDPNLSATSATDLFSQDFSQFSSATSPLDVADKNDEKSSDINDVADVADKNQGEARNGDIEVLGPAPAGERCTLCGNGGPVRIRHRGRVNLWHSACAARYLAALLNPPVKAPEPSPGPATNGRPHPALTPP